MLRLVLVDVLSHILEAAGDVRRFVARCCEDVVGGDDAADADQKEARHQHAGMLRQKGFDAGFPDAGCGGRGRRFRCAGGPGLGGMGGGLFSGQACAPVSEWLVRAKLYCMTAFTRRGFLAASSLDLAACAQRRVAIPPAPSLPRLARVPVSAGRVSRTPQRLLPFGPALFVRRDDERGSPTTRLTAAAVTPVI